MDSIVLNEYSTNFTNVSDKIEMFQDSNGDYGLFRVIDSTKQLTNIDQLNHIIHYLVVINGFLMEKQNNDVVTFTHSQNSGEDYAVYTYYPKDMLFHKYDRKFLSYIE